MVEEKEERLETDTLSEACRRVRYKLLAIAVFQLQVRLLELWKKNTPLKKIEANTADSAICDAIGNGKHRKVYKFPEIGEF